MANNEGWQSIHTRGQQTLGVWGAFAPDLVVGELTRLGHLADNNALPTDSQVVKDQEEVVDDRRAARDAVMATIADLTVRLPRKLEGEIAVGDTLHEDIEDVRKIEITDLASALTRGQTCVSTIKKYNVRNAAANPPKPPLTVGGFGIAAVEAALVALPQTTQAVEDERGVLKDKRSDLRTRARRVDQNNKRWYVAWEGEFPADSPERAALSQIDTGGGGGGEPPPPVVTTLTTSLSPTELALTASAPGASFYNYYHQAPGESGPTQIASEAGTPYATGVPVEVGDHLYTAAAVIEGVEGAMSAPATVNIPPP